MGSRVITGRHLAILLLVLPTFGFEPGFEPGWAMARPDDGSIEQELRAEGTEAHLAVSGRYSVQSAGDALHLARILSSFDTAYRVFWQGHLSGAAASGASIAAARPVNVIVFSRPESLHRMAARLGVMQPSFDAGGLFLRESLTIAVVNESRLDRIVEASLVHEAAHLLNLEILGPALSPWLNEGLAGFCQYSAVTRDGELLLGKLDEGSELRLPQEDGSEVLYQFVPKKSLSYLLGQFFRDHGLSLRPMLEAGSAERFYGQDAQLHYAASWTLVHLLAEGRIRRGEPMRPRLDRYTALDREGRGGSAALLGVMEMSMEDLDDAWYRHVKKLW